MATSILIVEDEKIVARDLQLVLEDLGYSVPAIANTGELAIQKAFELKPDLILMDIRLLGEMDGISTAQIVVDQLDIPIVYLTAHSDETTLARAKLTHPYGYLIKPFEERELRAVIEIALYKHEMECRLKENAQWLSTVLNSIGDAVLTTDAEGRITMLNAVAEKLTGWSCEEALNRPSTDVFNLIHEASRKIVSNPINEAISTQKIVMLPPLTLLVRKDGIEIPIEDSVAPITLHKGTAPIQDGKGQITGAVVIFRDVTQQRLSAKKLHRHAFYDDLTNLPNRAWFRERLTDAVERVKRQPDYLFAVLLLDLDRFKVVNDSLGHAAGDQLLIAVAERLTKACRIVDTISRLGGDEFAILLEFLKTEQEAAHVAQRIHRELSLPFYLEGQEVFTNASIGIVSSSAGYEQIEELIRDADIAMYRAKAQGKGSYQVFDTQMRDQIVAASRLERDLRHALEREQLEVYYQPIVSLVTQETIGFEALVRWNHPQRGIVSAAEFVPIAEETGLSILMDWWVLKEACTQMKRWQQQYPERSNLTISVNLSGKQIIQPNLVEYISQILADTDLNPQCLTLEITETAIIEKPELAINTLGKLKELGIRLSLDDFGTGYSSLSYLQRFPVNSLKIDRSFVNRMDVDSDSLEIVRAMILLGKTLGMTVVAEGIETPAQLNLLQQMDSNHGQGYYFAKPLPESESTNWLKLK
ncbi:GGDEF domain-containing response regulator [Merismopedia glauca]|uniref:Two-component system response regulator n=1 Tax=Merismopedia glauca CCAP 1448/3 TaxID=1296344 RepID=A0A2T1BYL3_9CYAN|nr:EAL domain-containing protein [Merismopedia glauca]PSB01125.1 two-component system response regulator [Merismopedia glauca CCAP 1448/3]